MPDEMDCLKCELPECNEKDPGCQFYKITRGYTPRANRVAVTPVWKLEREARRLDRQRQRDAKIAAEIARRESRSERRPPLMKLLEI